MKIKIHPLFFIFGLYFALTGKVFLFLTACLSALLHEMGHMAAAQKLGYRMNKITLMPYGAVVNGAIDGLSYKDEVLVALAGPITNLFVCLFFTALWWVFPECYLYTDTVVFTNLSIATINLLPAYPLDGGRIFCALLSGVLPRERALKMVRAVGVFIFLILFALFVFSCFHELNLSLLFFALFMLFGAVVKTKESAYVKIFKNRSLFFCGVKPILHLAVNSTVTLKQLLSLLSGDSFFALDVVYKRTNKIVHLDPIQTETLLSSYRFYDKIEELLPTVLNKNKGL